MSSRQDGQGVVNDRARAEPRVWSRDLPQPALTRLDQRRARVDDDIRFAKDSCHRRLEGGLGFVPRPPEAHDRLTDPVATAHVDPSLPSGRLL